MNIKTLTYLTILAVNLTAVNFAFADETAPASEQVPAEAPAQVQIVTDKHNYEEMDKLSQAMIQLCQPDECAAQIGVLNRLAPMFKGVAFVQMSTADNTEFANRIKQEEEEGAEMEHYFFVRWWRALMRYVGWGGELAKVQYPVYIFKSDALNVAHGVTSIDDLKKFVNWNASFEEEGKSAD